MSRIFDGKTIGDFRSERQKEALEKFEARKHMEAAQREQSKREVEAAQKPLHEEMQNKAARLTTTMQQFQPGDPRAAAVMRRCFLEFLEIMGYVLEITAPRACATPERETQEG